MSRFKKELLKNNNFGFIIPNIPDFYKQLKRLWSIKNYNKILFSEKNYPKDSPFYKVAYKYHLMEVSLNAKMCKSKSR